MHNWLCKQVCSDSLHTRKQGNQYILHFIAPLSGSLLFEANRFSHSKNLNLTHTGPSTKGHHPTPIPLRIMSGSQSVNILSNNQQPAN